MHYISKITALAKSSQRFAQYLDIFWTKNYEIFYKYCKYQKFDFIQIKNVIKSKNPFNQGYSIFYIWYFTDHPDFWSRCLEVNFSHHFDQVKPYVAESSLLAHVCFTDQKYRKTIISHCMTTYSPCNFYFSVNMLLLMAQLHKTDFLKASSAKLRDIMLPPMYIF